MSVVYVSLYYSVYLLAGVESGSSDSQAMVPQAQATTSIFCERVAKAINPSMQAKRKHKHTRIPFNLNRRQRGRRDDMRAQIPDVRAGA